MMARETRTELIQTGPGAQTFAGDSRPILMRGGGLAASIPTIFGDCRASPKIPHVSDYAGRRYSGDRPPESALHRKPQASSDIRVAR